MMQQRLHQIIAAIGETFEADFAQAIFAPAGSDVRETATFMERQILQMTDLFFFPFVLFTIFFSWMGFFKGGQRFEHLPLSARQQQIRAWKTSRIGSCRMLMNVYESLSLVGRYGA
ncbi:MAG: hypothetical protein AAB733_00430 [Patescibacteria group bacterium]